MTIIVSFLFLAKCPKAYGSVGHSLFSFGSWPDLKVDCGCGEAAVKRTVTKEGPNKGNCGS